MRALPLLLALAAGAPALEPTHDLDGTELRVEVLEARHTLRVRAVIQGHARAPTSSIALALHPALRVQHVESGWGPCDHLRDPGQDLRILFPRVLEPGERWRLVVDYAGALRDPRLAPGPSVHPLTGAGRRRPLAGLGAHLGPAAGLVLPRESYWYPRPRHRDPQELEVRLILPRAWEVSARAFQDHEVPQPGRRKALVLRTHGRSAYPLGLAAGPYEVSSRAFGEATIRWLRYRRELAEHPPGEPAWEEVERLMAALRGLLGEPGRGRLDLVQLMGSLPRRVASTGLSQGSFLWLAGPWPELDLAGREFLARELARFWFERGVQLDPASRKGVTAFAAMLALRETEGDEAFRALCRAAARRYGSDVHPGTRVLSPEIDDWEIDAPVPERVPAGRNLVMALLQLYQRKGPEVVVGALRTVVEEGRGGRATAQEILARIDRAPPRRRSRPYSARPSDEPPQPPGRARRESTRGAARSRPPLLTGSEAPAQEPPR